jgi:hypothetical protein
MTRNQIDVAGRLFFDLFPDNTEVIDGDHPKMEKIFDAFSAVMKEQSTGYLEIQRRLSRTAVEYERVYNEILGPEIEACRVAQDKQWGGPEHDDTHGYTDWCEYVQKFINRAKLNAMEPLGHPGGPGWISSMRYPQTNFEHNLVCIAALAVAAIQSSRRKRGLTNSAEQPNPTEKLSEKGELA